MIMDETIKGVKLTFSIEFNKKDKGTYIDKVLEIQDKLSQIIEEELKHDVIIGLAEPIVNGI